MKLHARFLQLPVRFDAGLLAREIASLGESAWMPHPAGYAGNDFLPLISADGDPNNEAFEGPMRPTHFLSPERPYLMEVLASLGAVLGRTRLMRLSGHADVEEHADVNYYWRDRMRVHIPIVTQPTVTFYCGDQNVHMAAGECWVFDTWSLHKVTNDAERARIHLVADTVGGDAFMALMLAGRLSGAPAPPNWTARDIAPTGAKSSFELESVNVPTVMSPWELREHINFLLAEAEPNQPIVAEIARVSGPFVHRWRALWSAHGDDEAAWPRYRGLIDSYLADLTAVRADQMLLRNDVDFFTTLMSMVMSVAVSDQKRDTSAGEQRTAPGPG